MIERRGNCGTERCQKEATRQVFHIRLDLKFRIRGRLSMVVTAPARSKRQKCQLARILRVTGALHSVRVDHVMDESFVAQRRNRIEARRAACRPEAGGKRDEARAARRSATSVEQSRMPLWTRSFRAVCRRRSRRRCRWRARSRAARSSARRISHQTCCACAPSAIRTPISCVRCDTEYAVTA